MNNNINLMIGNRVFSFLSNLKTKKKRVTGLF